MNPAEVRRRVLEAIERGEIPKSGLCELAANDLPDGVPAGYWERRFLQGRPCSTSTPTPEARESWYGRWYIGTKRIKRRIDPSASQGAATD